MFLPSHAHEKSNDSTASLLSFASSSCDTDLQTSHHKINDITTKVPSPSTKTFLDQKPSGSGRVAPLRPPGTRKVPMRLPSTTGGSCVELCEPGAFINDAFLFDKPPTLPRGFFVLKITFPKFQLN